MSPRETAGWTPETVRAWAESLFATHDHAARIARSETERVERRVDKVEGRLQAALTEYLRKDEYQARHQELEKRLEELQRQIIVVENWKSNVTGRVVGIGAIGVLFTAVVVAFISHLLS